MTEQQFVLDKLYYTIMTPIEKIDIGRGYMTYGEVVSLLNEQQATIESKEKTITIQKKGLEEYSNQIVDLSKKVGEQQATIESLKMELELRTGAKLFSRRELEMKVKEQQATISALHEENEKLKKRNKALKEDINQSEKRVKHWMMLYGDVYDKMQKRRVSG